MRAIVTQGAPVAGAGLAADFLGLGPLDLPPPRPRRSPSSLTTAQIGAVFNARRATGSGFRGAGSNPYLWMALGLTIALEAAAFGVPPRRDLLELDTLQAMSWLVAIGSGLIPLTVTQGWRIARAERLARQGGCAAAPSP